MHVVAWDKPWLAHCGCYIVPVPEDCHHHNDEDDDFPNTDVTLDQNTEMTEYHNGDQLKSKLAHQFVSLPLYEQ